MAGEEPQLLQLLQEAIKQDERINKAALPHVESILDRFDRLEEWGVASRVLIAHYQTAKTALKQLSPQKGWKGVTSIRNRINNRIQRLGQTERQESLTPIERLQAAARRGSGRSTGEVDASHHAQPGLVQGAARTGAGTGAGEADAPHHAQSQILHFSQKN